MKIRILAFATAADAVGAGELELELPHGSRVADLRPALLAGHPALEPVWDRLAIAVDGRMAGAEETLTDGCEVALLPPVSGGEETPARLTEAPIDLAEIERECRNAAHGALLLFVGRVRDQNAGRTVRRLTYDAYRPMAESALVRIVGELEAASPGLNVRIVHRLGSLVPGEPSVVIAVSSPHRGEAYRASRSALERLKREAPIWKREQYDDGESVWREEEPLAAGR